ncbi:TonB-dependent receptor domain-containing protein [Phenylobacterium sp.]|uniref:TonB-dependent receptor n=1 Tax=Phenylobacterium sp. TaxID=1871053 RepID=UPI00286B1601|nr:TonB-dependent receptor [Phenylobacterium sp.]
MLNQPLRLRSFFVMGASIAALTAAAAPALAQDTGFTIEELVVTAEKREQSLQDVPVAVTAYTSEKRDLLGVATVEDLARITPSLSYTNNDRLSIRGFGRLTNAIGTDPSVALYSDGIFSNSMADSSTPSLFIERTEILRGPQGTLYGRNSIGGALNIISKRPSDEFEGEVRATVGNFGTHRVDGIVSGPVTEGLRYLLGGSIDRRAKGFIDNNGPAGDTGGVERYIIEAQVEADLGENVVARLRYTKFDWDDSYGVGNILESNISPYDTATAVGLGNPALYYNATLGFTGTNPAIADPYEINTNRTNYGKLSNHNRLHFDLTWDLEAVTVKYLAGYQSYVYDTGGDQDGTPRLGNFNVPLSATATAANVSPDQQFFYQERQKWWSNELNISSNSDGPLQWIVGVYQYHQIYDQPQGLRVIGDPTLLSPLSLATGGLAPPNPQGNYLKVDGHLEVDSWATFGQIDYELSDTWKLTAGLRYTKDEKQGTDFARYVSRSPTTTAVLGAGGVPAAAGANLAVDFTTFVVCGGPTIATCLANPLYANLRQLSTGGLERDLSGEWDAFTGTFGIQWQPDGDTNAYARYSRGYKSGGWLASNGLTPFPYADPEYVDSYELGLKKTWGGRLQVNSALFFSDYKGFQTPLTVVLNSTTGSTGSQFLNLDAEVWGFEFEGQWAPIDNLILSGSYAYLNTEIVEGCCFVDTTDPRALQPGARPTGVTLPNGNKPQTLVGNSLPLTPEHKFTLGANYTWQFSPGSLTAGATYTYTGDQQTSIWASPLFTSPSNEIIDARLLWKDADDRFTVIGFVKNLTDEVAYQSSTPTVPSPQIGNRRTVKLNFPRTYGVELQYRF